MSDLSRALGPMARRIGNMLARGVVTAVKEGSKLRSLQVRMMAGEIKDDIEHFEPYGYTSRPLPGAEHVSAFFDGDRSHGVTIVVADRRYRLAGLEAGEVALYDDLGQAVHLTRNGIVIKGAGLPVTITDTPQVNLDAPTVTCTGNVNITGNLTAANIASSGYVKDSTGKSMANMRSVYDSHTHPANGQAPTQKT